MNLELNDHNKKEYPPMHTAEHILNQTMVRMFGCKRSRNTHIERKKSKCDYHLEKELTAVEVKEIEDRVNEVINKNLSVTEDFVHIKDAKDLVDLSKLPDNVSEMLRIIRVGDYDVCVHVLVSMLTILQKLGSSKSQHTILIMGVGVFVSN